MRLVVALFVTFVSLPRLGADDLPTLETVAAAWDAAADKQNAVKLTWTDKEFRTGYISEDHVKTWELLRKEENRMRQERGEFPRPIFINRNQYQLESHFTFVRQGFRVRLDKKGIWAPLNEPMPQLDVQSLTYNGTKVRWRRDKHNKGKDQISDHDVDYNEGFIFHFPIAAFGKTLLGKLWHPGDILMKSKFAVEPHGPVQGLPSIQLTRNDEQFQISTTYVLIPSLDFAIAEYESRTDKTLISYRATFDVKRAVLPFVPSKSTFEWLENKNVLKKFERTYSAPDLAGRYPDSHFEIDWPKPGNEKPGK